MKIRGIVVGLLFAASSVALASDPPKGITLDEAIRIALAQSTTLRQAQNANALDAATVTQQKLSFLPSLSLSTSGANSYGRNFSQADGAIVNQTTQSMSAGLSSSVTLFDGLKNVSSLREAQLSQNASEQDLARARQTVVFTVASNYLTLVAQQEQLRVQRENLASLEAQLAQIQQLVDVGTRPISDLYQQQATVASTRAAIVDAQRAVELVKVDLMQTLQLDPRGTYEFTPPGVNDSSALTQRFDLDSLLERAFAQRTDLQAQSSRVAAAGQGTKVAGATKLPSVALTAGYNTAYSSASALAFQDQLDQRRGGSIGISVSIPLFDRGATQVAEERARLAEDNARLALDNQKQQIGLEVRRAYLDWSSAKERLTAAEAQQKAADLAVQASQQRYNVGAATLVELTQARAGLVQAQSAVISARYTLVFQQALMSYYTGDLTAGSVKLG